MTNELSQSNGIQGKGSVKRNNWSKCEVMRCKNTLKEKVQSWQHQRQVLGSPVSPKMIKLLLPGKEELMETGGQQNRKALGFFSLSLSVQQSPAIQRVDHRH